jgi:hypothetical protein
MNAILFVSNFLTVTKQQIIVFCKVSMRMHTPLLLRLIHSTAAWSIFFFFYTMALSRTISITKRILMTNHSSYRQYNKHAVPFSQLSSFVLSYSRTRFVHVKFINKAEREPTTSKRRSSQKQDSRSYK